MLKHAPDLYCLDTYVFSLFIFLMLFYRGRRLCRPRLFIIFTAVIVSVFLMYQLFSVRQLGKELSRRRPRSKLQTNFKNYEKADGFMPVRYTEEKKKDIDAVKDVKSLPKNVEPIPGVLPRNRKLYIPSSKNTFRCLQSGEEINFSMVNDNFCDCSDNSDEPSTSACSYGRFYCTYQSKSNPNDIVSYKVNDGICDCCDGSDEWNYVALPAHSKITANQQRGVYQTPCSFRCH